MSDSDNKKFWLEQRRKGFEASLEACFNRAQRVPVLNVIPGEFFSRGSYECREFFIEGHFVGCVSLCQGVAEGLSRFLVSVKGIHVQKMDDHRSRYSLLWRNKIITDKSRDSFKALHGDDRNDFHHFNESLLTDYRALEQRAEEALRALVDIESDVFSHTFESGKIVPKYPEFWTPGDESGTVLISLRQHF